MKKQMLLGVSLVALALTTVHSAAADMAVKAPPAAPAIAPPFSWTGPYAGTSPAAMAGDIRISGTRVFVSTIARE